MYCQYSCISGYFSDSNHPRFSNCYHPWFTFQLVTSYLPCFTLLSFFNTQKVVKTTLVVKVAFHHLFSLPFPGRWHHICHISSLYVAAILGKVAFRKARGAGIVTIFPFWMSSSAAAHALTQLLPPLLFYRFEITESLIAMFKAFEFQRV